MAINTNPECKLQIVIDSNHGFTSKFTNKLSFWFVCATHKIECGGPIPDGFVSCPVTGQTLLTPFIDF